MTREEAIKIYKEVVEKYEAEFGETPQADHLAYFAEELISRRAGQFAINELDKKLNTQQLKEFQEIMQKIGQEETIEHYTKIVKISVEAKNEAQAVQVENVHLGNFVTQEQGDEIAKMISENYVFHKQVFKTKSEAKRDDKK